MSPRIQLALSISAIIYGFTLVAALIYGSNVASHPIEIFLGVLLLAGGMLFLWLRWAPRPEAPRFEITDRSAARAAVLGTYVTATAAPPVPPAAPPAPVSSVAPIEPVSLTPDDAANPVEPEMSDEEFLAPFLKK